MAEHTHPFDRKVEYYPPSILARHGGPSSTHNTEPPESPKPPAYTSADIDWIPDFAKFQKRLKERSSLVRSEAAGLPKGWPSRLDSPLAWTGSDLHPGDYVFELSQANIQEINNALLYFKGLGLELDDVRRATFPLPTLAPQLSQLSSSLYHGIGFCVLRGLNPKLYSREDNVIIYLGLSSYFGEQRGRQYQDGLMLGHITEVKFDDVPDNLRRPLFTNASQPFHTDLICGVLAMHFIDTAAKGGEVLLSSSWRVYNEMVAQSRPDIINTLSKDDWVHDTFGRNPAYHRRPIMHHWRGRLVTIFSRRNLVGSEATPRSPGIPPVTEAQAEALDAVHFAAAAHAVTVQPRPGDFMFVNNFALMHSRNAWEDSGASKRYVLRLWLNDPERGWEVPPALRLGWARIFEEADEITNFWDVDPDVARGRMPRLDDGDGDGNGGSGGGGGGKGGGSNGRSTSCG